MTQSQNGTAPHIAHVLEARGIRKTFHGHSGEVLCGVDFKVAKGEKVCILGPSGSGKTTFLRCLNLLVEPSGGTLLFEGEQVGEWPAHRGSRPRNLNGYRSRIGMVFQHFELFPHLTALDNVTLGPRRVLGIPKDDAVERGRALLDRVGLSRFAQAKPGSLSGGQRQRVAIARALAMQPAAILCDEPTSALDAEMVGDVLNLLSSLAAEGMTMVIVTHELAFARDVSDRVVVMEHGVVVEEGTARRMFESPVQQRTREILGGRVRI